MTNNNKIAVEVKVFQRGGRWHAFCAACGVNISPDGCATRDEAVAEIPPKIFAYYAQHPPEKSGGGLGLDIAVCDVDTVPPFEAEYGGYTKIEVTCRGTSARLSLFGYSDGDRSGVEGWFGHHNWPMDVARARELRDALNVFIAEMEANAPLDAGPTP